MITEEQRKKLETDATMREVYDLRVYVVGGGYQYAQMFYEAGFRGARSVEDANIICFTGGEDVTPSYYGETALQETYFNVTRDAKEREIYADAVLNKKALVGICRGAQFLNVMNGGKLWQDVNNHAIGGGHAIVDMRDGSIVQNMTSTHHQQMRAADGAEIIATAARSTHKRAASEEVIRTEPENDDMEVLWYPQTLSLCFQPHPEFGHGDCRNFFLDLVDEYVMPAC